MPDPILKQVKEALDKAIAEKRVSQEMVRNLSPAIIQTLTPILQEIATNARLTKEDILQSLSQLKIEVPKSEVEVKMPTITVPEANVKVSIPEIKIPEVKVNIPEIKLPKIVIPEIKVPEIKIPLIKIPKMEWPEGNMPVEGLMMLKGIDRKNPLPVELRNADGSPMKWPEYIGGGSVGLAHNVKIGGFSESAYLDYINADGRLRVSVETGGSGLTDSELRASHLDVDQLSGATWSVSVNDAFRTTVASALINSDDRLRVSLETGGSGLTDSELRAAHIDVVQMSGTIDSVFITGSADSMMAFQARQTNITALADGADSRPITDDLGRQVVRPVQVRDLMTTAYATLTTGTATTLLQSGASVFNDLIYLVGANNSDAAVTVNISPGSAEGTVLTLQIPANGTAGVACPVPMPQNTAANAWTADMGDITGTTVYLSALFSKEV